MADPSILERVAAGDHGAVRECVDQYGNLVWSLARRFLKNPADAEDAVQDIFIELWSCADRYDRSIAKESTFIATICRRRLIDRIRSAGRAPSMDSLDDRPPAAQPAVAGGMSVAAEISGIEQVLESMESPHRQILSMSFYQGYSHSEIATRLNIPLGTVKTRVRRGLQQIRRTLNVDIDEDGRS